MKVSEVGEFGLIDRLTKLVNSSRDDKSASWKQLIIGIGDDAAAWRTDTSIHLATVDSFIQDVHFTREILSWFEIGWKALATNLSDIAAMGGVPRHALVALTCPDTSEVEDITDLYRGMIDLAKRLDLVIIGGDVDCATTIAITITVLGTAHNATGPQLIRSSARPGDKIAVTGYLGAASAGLLMLTHGLKFDSRSEACLKKAFCRPYPRITEGKLILNHGIKTAIDISDGLISDLRQICKASQVGASVEIGKIPILPAVMTNFRDRAIQLALSGGEDYELLFTGNAETIDKVIETANCPVTIIGEITASNAEEINLIDKHGAPYHLDKPGWEHFLMDSD